VDKPEIATIPDNPAANTLVNALPPLVIYKTRFDYQMLVPVTLNPEKTAVTDFPAPTDLFYEGELAIPANLEQGYMLDFRGVNRNTAFLRMTYEQYGSFDHIPTAAELFPLVLDPDPFTEIYICGVKQGKQADIIKANELIKAGKLGEDCKNWKQ
jgi:hypothetical protein